MYVYIYISYLIYSNTLYVTDMLSCLIIPVLSWKLKKETRRSVFDLSLEGIALLSLWTWVKNTYYTQKRYI